MQNAKERTTTANPGPSTGATRQPADAIVRFDVHQRIQHILMFTSFLVLAFTGLAEKFFTLGISQWLISSLGGLEMTQTIHHVAAYVMIFDCAYHAIYLIYSMIFLGRTGPLQMIPSPQDFLDLVQNFLFFLGLTTKRPQFRRFSYLEKFDYWAVFWGMVIIGGSGVVLLFPVQISTLIGGPIVPVALAAHSDEAVLAVLWIFIVHFFYAHLAPNVFPLNTSIFTGLLSRRRYREEHPLAAELSEASEAPAAEPALPKAWPKQK